MQNSLLGKKRAVRDEEDDDVRLKTYLIQIIIGIQQNFRD